MSRSMPIPEQSPIYCAQLTLLNEGETKTIILDFHFPTDVEHRRTFPSFNLDPEKSVVILKCDLPSAFVLDIVYFIIIYSQRTKIFLQTRTISSEGLAFLKKIGMVALVRDCNAELNIHSTLETTIIERKESNVIQKLRELSTTEISILYYVSIGLTNSQIAELVCRSYHTVKNHKINIVRKIGLEHCSQLSEFCQRLKLSIL